MDLNTNRNYLLRKLQSKTVKVSDFNFDRLQAPPLWQFIRYDDIERLRKFATSLKYSSKPVEKLQEINRIMTERNFKKVTGGTNRVIYKHLEYDPVLFKVAFDATGIRDSPREYENQFYYKPFVSKVFEVSPCGVIEEVEKGIPITSRAEFLSIADDVYDVIRNWFIGDRVMDDIGTEYFMNWALRPGFGPILIDFPYSYKLDGNKLYCNATLKDGSKCGGMIDYDDGFNHLQCTKCGAKYKAVDLEKAVDDGIIIQKGSKKRRTNMIVSWGRGDDIRTSTGKDNFDPIEEMAKRVIRPPRRGGRPNEVGEELTITIKGGSVGKRRTVNNPDNDDENEKVEVTTKRERMDTVENKEEVIPRRGEGGEMPPLGGPVTDTPYVEARAVPRTPKPEEERPPMDSSNVPGMTLPDQTTTSNMGAKAVPATPADKFMIRWNNMVDENSYKMIEHTIKYPLDTDDGIGLSFTYHNEEYFAVIQLDEEKNCYRIFYTNSNFSSIISDDIYYPKEGEKIRYSDVTDEFISFLIENEFVPLLITNISSVSSTYIVGHFSDMDDDYNDEDESTDDDDMVVINTGEKYPEVFERMEDELEEKYEGATNCAVFLTGETCNLFALCKYYEKEKEDDKDELEIIIFNDDGVAIDSAEFVFGGKNQTQATIVYFAHILIDMLQNENINVDPNKINDFKFIDPSIILDSSESEQKDDHEESFNHTETIGALLTTDLYRGKMENGQLGFRLTMTDGRKLYLAIMLDWSVYRISFFLYNPYQVPLETKASQMNEVSIEVIPGHILEYFKKSLYARIEEIADIEIVKERYLFEDEDTSGLDESESDNPKDDTCPKFFVLDAITADADDLSDKFGIDDMKNKLGTVKCLYLSNDQNELDNPHLITTINGIPVDQFVIMKKEACVQLISKNNELETELKEIKERYNKLLIDAAAEQDKMMKQQEGDEDTSDKLVVRKKTVIITEPSDTKVVFKTSSSFIPENDATEVEENKEEADSTANSEENNAADDTNSSIPVGAAPPRQQHDSNNVPGLSSNSYQKYPVSKTSKKRRKGKKR